MEPESDETNKESPPDGNIGDRETLNVETLKEILTSVHRDTRDTTSNTVEQNQEALQIFTKNADGFLYLLHITMGDWEGQWNNERDLRELQGLREDVNSYPELTTVELDDMETKKDFASQFLRDQRWWRLQQSKIVDIQKAFRKATTTQGNLRSRVVMLHGLLVDFKRRGAKQIQPMRR